MKSINCLYDLGYDFDVARGRHAVYVYKRFAYTRKQMVKQRELALRVPVHHHNGYSWIIWDGQCYRIDGFCVQKTD